MLLTCPFRNGEACHQRGLARRRFLDNTRGEKMGEKCKR